MTKPLNKTRILFCGEASWLSTGFATYNREIMRRLHKSGEYEIAEMGSYAHPNDPKGASLPWKFYGVIPVNEKEAEVYKKNKLNEFGAYKVDAVLADFQPDIVFDGRDPWMVQHLVNNKFRDNYKLILVPTVDSEPQKKEWIETIFKKADVVCTYSKFGKRVLESEGMNIPEVLSPGVDLEVFNVLDKAEVRKKWCLKNGLTVIGTVMRNQKRKLFPDLFEAYKLLRDRNKDDKEIQRSVLLCHTSFPDLGWDIPELIQRNSLQRHVVFTYICDSCDNTFVSWFIPCNEKGRGKCVSCGEPEAHMPNTHKGFKLEELVEVFNLMDIYIQPAICEGWGVPIVEAKACGVPGMYSNFSAMIDHVNNGGGIGINIDRVYTEAETMAKRSLPDRSDIANKMKMLIKDKELRERLSKKARRIAEKKHNWNITSDALAKIINNLELHDRGKTWDAQPQIKYMTPERPPSNLNNQDFVYWCYLNILGRKPDDKGLSDWINGLQNGTPRHQVEGFFRNEIVSKNKFEQARWNRSMKIRGKDPEIVNKNENQNNMMPGVII